MRPVYLLDTDILSELCRKTPSASILDGFARHQGLLAICAPVWHELRYGIERLPQGHRREEIDSFVMEVVAPNIPIIPYDDHAAWIHARFRAALEAKDRTPSFVDAQIASIAVAGNLILVSRNTQDFRDFHGLMLEDWSVP